MKRSLVVVGCLLVAAALGLAGCEWSGSSNDDGTAWNTSTLGAADFGGKYAPDTSISAFVVSSFDDPSLSGATGVNILSLFVSHKGTALQMTDNYGMHYTGVFANPSVVADTNAVVTSASAEFDVTGTSKAGKHVHMTGRISNGVMRGLWSEAGAKNGDINALRQ
jgi:hypothetical protein